MTSRLRRSRLADMPEDEPITVLMPVRNAAGTVGRAVGDLLAGMSPSDEFLVVDDGSDDNSASVISSFEDPRIRLVATPGLGLVGALNLGLKEASHRWVARADADDRYPPSRLSAQRQARREGVVLVTGDYNFIVDSQPIGSMPCALSHPFVIASLIHPQRVPHPGVLFDSDAVQASGGYRSDDFPAEDLALWLRLADVGDFVGVPTAVVDWTMSVGSITHTHQAVQRERTAQLLAVVFPTQQVAGISPDDALRELHSQQGTPMAAQRGVLLARDLRSLAARGVAGPAYKEVRRALSVHPIDTARALGQLAREKRRRDRLRSTLKPS
jgi:hypothetical protein